MFLIKLAALTSFFYVAIAALIQGAILGWAFLGDKGVAIFIKRGPFMAVFAVVWLISFALAWHVLYSRFATTLPR